MNHPLIRAGIGYAPGAGRQWQAALLEGLAGVCPALPVALPGRQAEALPLPWRALLPLEKALARPATDLFAPWEPGGSALEDARPDILVLPPGLDLPEGSFRPPLGVLRLEPVHPLRMAGGALEARLTWELHGGDSRLAANAFTCLDGPFPLAWASAHLAKAAAMPTWVAARLMERGEAFAESLPVAQSLPPFRPKAADWAAFARELAAYGLTRAWQDLLHRRQWFVAARPGDGDPLRPGFAAEPFAPLYPPKGTGWADPFLFERQGRQWLFVEEIPGRGKGELSVLERLPDGTWGPSRPVLREPFHLSYPQVFEHGGAVYMTPESGAARQVRLYRATDFPGGWVLDRVLLDDVAAADATFLEHGGRWWLFATVKRPGGSSWDELCLFHAPGRLGPYEPHPLNPVVRDVRRGRPAGRILERGGRLFRPAQDSSGCYGRALAILEITRLDPEGYEERPVARLGPDMLPGSFCLHAFEAQGGLEVVDGQRWVPLWR